MQIDYALILSAGLGTRMGEIGKKLPKVLWPIYFKNLLELQINYCKDLGIKKIYVNTHYLHNEIFEFLKLNRLDSDVILLHEEILLDSGGAIHNLAERFEVNYSGSLLIVNGDQFLFFEKKYWEKAFSELKDARAVLFGIKVNKESAYNETVLENNKLLEIKKNEKTHDFITYSGLGILDLTNLKRVAGASKFFETVANFRNEKIIFVTPSQFEYWDYGTAAVYAKNIFAGLDPKNKKSELVKFLNAHNAFNGQLENFLEIDSQSINLDYRGMFENNSIVFRDIKQKI